MTLKDQTIKEYAELSGIPIDELLLELNKQGINYDENYVIDFGLRKKISNIYRKKNSISIREIKEQQLLNKKQERVRKKENKDIQDRIRLSRKLTTVWLIAIHFNCPEDEVIKVSRRLGLKIDHHNNLTEYQILAICDEFKQTKNNADAEKRKKLKEQQEKLLAKRNEVSIAITSNFIQKTEINLKKIASIIELLFRLIPKPIGEKIRNDCIKQAFGKHAKNCKDLSLYDAFMHRASEPRIVNYFTDREIDICFSIKSRIIIPAWVDSKFGDISKYKANKEINLLIRDNRYTDALVNIVYSLFRGCRQNKSPRQPLCQ